MQAGFFVSERTTMKHLAVNEDVASLVSLKLTMTVEELPTLECTFHAAIDVTRLDSKAREFALAEPVTRRYKLVEIPEELSLT